MRSCYEAGLDGFWLHRYLETQGIENIVVDPASVEVNRRAKQRKTDKLDAQKLVRHLMRYHAGDADVWKVQPLPVLWIVSVTLQIGHFCFSDPAVRVEYSVSPMLR